MVKTTARIVATSLVKGVNDYIDNYILCVEERDNMLRAWFDMKDYERIQEAMEKDLRDKMSIELDKIVKEFNQTGKITRK